MFNTKLSQPIDTATESDRLLAALAHHEPESSEYTKILDHLSKLDSLKRDNAPKPVSNDTKASILANITGLLLVIHHERANIITSKALSMLPRLR